MYTMLKWFDDQRPVHVAAMELTLTGYSSDQSSSIATMRTGINGRAANKHIHADCSAQSYR